LTLNLSKKLEMMNELRKTRHVSEAGEDMRKLWVWYGLELMVGVSRKEWAWRKLINRTTKLFTDCVVVGDEALALQVISLRAEMYIKEREEKNANADVGETKKKRGRKSYVEGDDSTMVLTERMGIFLRMRNDIIKIRRAAPNDDFGWDRFLRDVEENERTGCTSVNRSGSKSNTKEIRFNCCEIPMDEVVYL
jgi:hypothetical protein